MIKHKEQRVGVFVDVANMYHSAKNLYKAKVNFKEVLKTATAGRKLIRAITYVIKSESEEERGFFGALSNQGFEVKAKDLQVFAGGAKKADWDVGVAIDAIKMADKLDSVIIVSGDGDYVPLVTYLKENKGCQVEVVAFGKTTSSKLISAADDFIDLGQDVRKYLITDQKRLRLIKKITRR
jgi:uncharacterized LabA/DUF88 family protein